MKTIYELQQIANRLRQVTEVNSISPEDTFGLQSDILEYLADMEQNAEGLGIHKVYASYAAMVADASSPVGSNGKALRFGQLVVICNPSNTIQEENGNIYAWQKGNAGDAAWLLIGNLGSVLGNPQNGYYVCDTAAATAEKEISATGYVLSVGGSMKVKMANANTADNATLNINSTGVKALYYAGERASANNSWEAGETVEVYYDGTSYYANSVAGGSGSGDGAFDVSAKYPTSGVDGGNTYTLDGALAVLNANLSASKKKGGMSIKFIQSSDNKYVQYRLKTDSFSTYIYDWINSSLESPSNYLASGFSLEPINFNNANSKIEWSSNLYFRIGGATYTVLPGEIDYSSYTEIGTALALILNFTNIVIPDSNGAKEATMEIVFNGKEDSSPIHVKGAVGNFVVAWFYRSGSSWSAGPIVSAYSVLPVTIDGKYQYEGKMQEYINASDKKELDTLVYQTSSVSPIGYYQYMKYEIDVTGKIGNQDGAITDASYRVNFRQVKKGDILQLKATFANGSTRAFRYGFSSTRPVLGTVLTGFTQIYDTTVTEYFKNIISPIDGWFAYFMYDSYYPTSFGVSCVKKVQETIDINSYYIEGITLPFSSNKYIEGASWSENFGAIISDTDVTDYYGVSEPIELSGCKYIRIQRGNASTLRTLQNVVLAGHQPTSMFYNSNDEPIESVQNLLFFQNVTDGYPSATYIYIKVPENAAYFRYFSYYTRLTVGLLRNKIDAKIAGIEENSKYNDFQILPLVNNAITATGLNPETSSTRASQETLFAVPFNGCSIITHFKNPNMVMGIRSGADADNLSTNRYWMKDGDTYTIPISHNYYRVSFAILRANTNPQEYDNIVASKVEELLLNGSVSVKYVKKDAGIVERSYDSDPFVKAVILNLDGARTGNGMLEFPLFAHITDAHGDVSRVENAVDYAKYLGVDALLATGDIIANNIKDNFKGLSDKLTKYDDIPTLYCRGNHETYGNSDVNFDVYSKYYQALATKYSYNISDGKTYYYKDFSGKKIRIIAVDPYEDNIITNNTGAYSQAQINWFVTTLKSTPQDYGIIIISHSPESVPYNSPSIVQISGKNKFFLDGTPLYWTTPKGLSIAPLMKIVDAFISRGTLVTTFTETTQSGEETIEINADFTSGIATGVEFIAWVCGHQHLDLIGEYNRTAYGLSHRQLVLDVTCATALYGSDSYPYLNNMSDLPRGGVGVVQDAITIYAIDRTNKEVRIARCGSRFTNKFVERNCITVPYIDEVNP